MTFSQKFGNMCRTFTGVIQTKGNIGGLQTDALLELSVI